MRSLPSSKNSSIRAGSASVSPTLKTMPPWMGWPSAETTRNVAT
jgi:hypothetical protein